MGYAAGFWYLSALKDCRRDQPFGGDPTGLVVRFTGDAAWAWLDNLEQR
jgi:hypothetical protein